jgi:hypothetical protein
MLTCRDATNLMTEEGEGTLSRGGRFLYGVHMTICAHCRAFRRQLRETIALAKSIPREHDAPAMEMEERVAAAFRARAKGSG